jgi:hypothetical protein
VPCMVVASHCVPDLTLLSGNANCVGLSSLQTLPCAGL